MLSALKLFVSGVAYAILLGWMLYYALGIGGIIISLIILISGSFASNSSSKKSDSNLMALTLFSKRKSLKKYFSF